MEVILQEHIKIEVVLNPMMQGKTPQVNYLSTGSNGFSVL